MKKNKKLFAILTLVAFMMTLVPALAFAAVTEAPTVDKGVGDENGVSLSINGLSGAAGSLSYQWTKDGSDIDSATEETYVATEAGEYAVKVTSTDTGSDTALTGTATDGVTVKEADLAIYNALVATDAVQDIKNAKPTITAEGMTFSAGNDIYVLGSDNKLGDKVTGAVVPVADAKYIALTSGTDITSKNIIKSSDVSAKAYVVTQDDVGAYDQEVAGANSAAGKASAGASTISFVDADETIETNTTADFQVVLKNASNSVVKATGSVYVWAESTSGQVSDALIIGLDANDNDKLDAGETILTPDAYGVYTISFADEYAVEYQAAFKRAGTYELKASLVKPEKGDVENVTKKLTQGANKSIKITSPAADGDNWVITVAPTASYTYAESATSNNGEDLAQVSQAADGKTVEYTLELKTISSKGNNPVSGMPISISTNGDISNKDTVTTDATGKAKFKLSSSIAGVYVVEFETANGGFYASLPVNFGGGTAVSLEIQKAPTSTVGLISGNEYVVELNAFDINGNKVSSLGSTSDLKYEFTTKPSGATANITFATPGSHDATIDAKIDVSKVGDYEVKIYLDSTGKSVKIPFTVAKQGTVTSMTLDYDTNTVAKGTATAAPTVTTVDADGVEVELSSNTGVTFALTGPATIATSGAVTASSDKEDIGKTVNVVATYKKVVANATLTITAGASTLVFEEVVGATVNSSVKVPVQSATDDGTPVALGASAGDDIKISYVVTEKPEGANVTVDTTGLTTANLKSGDAYIKVSSTKAGTVKVTILAVNTETDTTKNFTLNGIAAITFGDKVTSANDSATLVIGSNVFFVNGKVVTSDVAPFIQNGRTFLPVRALAEALGAEVEFDAATNKVTIKSSDVTAEMTLGSTIMTVNDEVVTMDAAAFATAEGRTVIPVRYAAQALGYELSITTNADGTTSSVTLSK